MIKGSVYNIMPHPFSAVPPRIKARPPKEIVKRGDTAVLRCEITGDQPIRVSWFVRGVRLMENVDPRWVNAYAIVINNAIASGKFKRGLIDLLSDLKTVNLTRFWEYWQAHKGSHGVHVCSHGPEIISTKVCSIRKFLHVLTDIQLPAAMLLQSWPSRTWPKRMEEISNVLLIMPTGRIKSGSLF